MVAMVAAPEYIYRVTEVIDNPSYWQPKRSVKIVTKRSVIAKLKSGNDRITSIERAPIGEWKEIETEDEIL